MARLEYKSLVTKETIDYYLSIIKDEDEKKDFLSTVSKFDIRISTEPVIKGLEFYYKIWILKQGTKKKAHIKQYYPLKLIDEERFKTIPLNLRDILDMIRLNADVPDDFEEYCAIWFRDASDEKNRIYYVEDLARARRFKKFISKEEIRSIPFLPSDNQKDKDINDDYEEDEKKKIAFDLNNKFILKEFGYDIVFLNDKKEYDKLADIQDTLEYYEKIMKNYGYDPHTGEYNEKMLPEPKEEKQKKNIAKDFKAYFKTLDEYADFLKELIKKYDIKLMEGNLLKVAFNLNNNDDDSEYKQRPYKFIRINVDGEDVFTNT
ncbi:MAG: hypothetical protein ACR2F1_07700 [Nitrososphaeraceae archaeon]